MDDTGNQTPEGFPSQAEAEWNVNFFRHGAHPGFLIPPEVAPVYGSNDPACNATEPYRSTASPIDLRLSVVPWPAHLADLRQHPGDIVLQVNVGRTIDQKANVDAEHERNHRLADAILERLQPETMQIATALHEAMANVGRCDECDTVWVGDGICPYCAGFEDGSAEADAARRATEFAVKQQEQAHAMLAARDRVIEEQRNEREGCLTQMADLRRQLDLARFDIRREREISCSLLQRLDAAADEVVRLRDQQARLRTLATRTLAAIVATLAAGALAWCCWDRLPHGSPSTWWTVVLALGALLVGRRWPRRTTPDIVWRYPDGVQVRPPVIHAQELPEGSPPDNTSSP